MTELTSWEDLVFENHTEPAPGMLLVSNPFMRDHNFRRTVVLLTEHNERGSMGFILNREFDLTLHELTRDFLMLDTDLYLGGPVQLDTLHFLHTAPDRIPDSVPVVEHVSWGGDSDVLRERITEGVISPDEIRFFVGYAGWGSQQLEHEIEQYGWVVTPATEEIVMHTPIMDLWREVLRRMGAQYSIIANFPEDPRLN